MTYKAQLLDGMVIFSEVVNCGSFTQAAQTSGHSTSFISKTINKLEARLGVRLLHRTTRSLSLTPEGQVYFEQCQQIINDAEQAETILSGRQLEPQGTLRISCPTVFGLSRMRPVFAGFMEKYPEVSLELDLSDHKVDMIAEGFDVLIRASQHQEDSSLISRHILRSHSVTIASPAYLQKYGTPKKPEDLIKHKLISYSNVPQTKLWQYQDKNNVIHNLKFINKVLTNSSEMEVSLCLAGQGITRLPLFNLKNEIETGALIELFKDFQRPVIDVHIMYPSRKHMSSKVRSFIDYVVETITTN